MSRFDLTNQVVDLGAIYLDTTFLKALLELGRAHLTVLVLGDGAPERLLFLGLEALGLRQS